MTPSLLQLHWLPVYWRIQYKLCVMMYHIHINKAPQYFTKLVSSVSATSARALRSINTTNNILPRLRTKFRESVLICRDPIYKEF